MVLGGVAKRVAGEDLNNTVPNVMFNEDLLGPSFSRNYDGYFLLLLLIIFTKHFTLVKGLSNWQKTPCLFQTIQ
jgi:hypothetical protein